ncbi:MAG: serine hydrolase [Muribaculaceae bacterium]|nr:serine hydrolase [Muribaculaceae bacterium]
MKRLRMQTAIVALMAVMSLGARDKGAQPTIFNNVDQKAMEAWVETQISAMTPEQRVSQLIIMAVDPKDDEPTRALVKRYVSENRVGGLIYNECTVHELASITNYAQSLAAVPLMITIDGEWGLAMRVDKTPKFPRNLLLGAIDDDKLLYQYGREVARELRRAGIHVNFAPVLDVNDNPKNPVIGSRSFGESPEQVSRHAIAYARGLEDGGVLSVGKHFPGHGSSIEDSHKTLPVIDKSMREINTCELVPFRHYIDAGLSGILMAHLNVPAIDDSGRPTTMSRRCVTDLLKKQMGFSGLVFTDALGMEGVKKNMTGSPCVNALLAGNDVLLMPANADAEVQAVMTAIGAGQLSQSDIDERCRKMLRYKYALGITTGQNVVENGLAAELNAAPSQALMRQLMGGAVTVIKNHKDILPIRNLQSRHIAVVTIGGEKGKKAMFHNRADDYAAITSYHYQTGESASALAQQLKDGRYNLILVALCDDDATSRYALQTIAKQCDHLVVTIMNKPYDIAHCADVITSSHVKAVVLTYQSGDLAEDYAVQTIFGGNAAQGNLPVSVKCGNKTYKAGHGIHYVACRLGYTLPSEVGMNDYLLHQIDSVANLGVRAKAFSGCQVVVGRHGKIVCKRSYGETDFGSGVAVDDNTLYGLASVSKATGTLSAVMKLYDDGKFKLDEPVSRVITDLRDGDKSDLTFRDLLYHETGMPASLNMWNMMMDQNTYTGTLVANSADDVHTIKIMNGAWGHKDARLRTDILSTSKTDRFNIAIADGIWGGRVTYDSIMQRIYHAKLGKKKYLYSCLNFCLLADAVQRMSKAPLNYFVNSYVFAPLGAYHTLYRPLSKFPREQIAYTEVDTYLRRQHIHGYVHDELAAFSGGVQGNAGLFSSANDLAKLLQLWLNGGTYGGMRFYKPSTVDVFTTQKSANSHRGLGFDKPVVGDPEASNTCAEATPETFGHTGFTGTCFWVDPKNDMFYIFLSNRVSPTRNNPNFSRISARSHIQSLIYKSLKD